MSQNCLIAEAFIGDRQASGQACVDATEQQTFKAHQNAALAGVCFAKVYLWSTKKQGVQSSLQLARMQAQHNKVGMGIGARMQAQCNTVGMEIVGWYWCCMHSGTNDYSFVLLLVLACLLPCIQLSPSLP
eukprot:TRINITY_DN16643_c0_g1_i1.p4 TRINITY_DN16643_c0_g1~~TRINITY_DN16643_c0_g1_i1.p4  ORF type:complete len:130 (+),score=9.84 TRINITY_DN16643_c0_g1_i1:1063-1452(+)